MNVEYIKCRSNEKQRLVRNMLRGRKTQQRNEYEIVLLEELIPEDHFLRKVDAAEDFSFIHDMCKELYSPDNGRPAIGTRDAV